MKKLLLLAAIFIFHSVGAMNGFNNGIPHTPKRAKHLPRVKSGKATGLQTYQKNIVHQNATDEDEEFSNIYPDLLQNTRDQRYSHFNDGVLGKVFNSVSNTEEMFIDLFNIGRPDIGAIERVYDLIHDVNDLQHIFVRMHDGLPTKEEILDVEDNTVIGMPDDAFIEEITKAQMKEPLEVLEGFCLSAYQKLQSMTSEQRYKVHQRNLLVPDIMEMQAEVYNLFAQRRNLTAMRAQFQLYSMYSPAEIKVTDLVKMNNRQHLDCKRNIVFSKKNNLDDSLMKVIEGLHCIVFSHPGFSDIIPEGADWMLFNHQAIEVPVV